MFVSKKGAITGVFQNMGDIWGLRRCATLSRGRDYCCHHVGLRGLGLGYCLGFVLVPVAMILVSPAIYTLLRVQCFYGFLSLQI